MFCGLFGFIMDIRKDGFIMDISMDGFIMGGFIMDIRVYLFCMNDKFV